MPEIKEEKTSSIVDVQETLGKAELYFEKNKKNIGTIAGIVIAVIAIISAYKYWWIPKQDAEAQNQLFLAQQYFEKDSLDLALNGGPIGGGKSVIGLKEIAENYGGTKSGKLAEYMIGVALLHKGKYEEAIEHLSKFSSDDIMLSAVATGAIGDANMELNKTEEAVKYYLKAADDKTNNFSTPIYLKKAAMAYETLSKYTESLKLYERIQQEFPKSNEGREIEKYISRVKSLGNL